MEFGLPDSTCAPLRQILTSYPQIETPALREHIQRVGQVFYQQ